MNYALLGLITILGVECFVRLPIINTAKLILGVGEKALRVISSKKISDHWKEKVLLRYSITMLFYSGKLALFLFTLFLIIAGACNIPNIFTHDNLHLLEQLTSYEGIVVMSITSVIYLKIKNYVS